VTKKLVPTNLGQVCLMLRRGKKGGKKLGMYFEKEGGKRGDGAFAVARGRKKKKKNTERRKEKWKGKGGRKKRNFASTSLDSSTEGEKGEHEQPWKVGKKKKGRPSI